MYFKRENGCNVSLDQMFKKFRLFIEEKKDYNYKIIIGTDSKVTKNVIKYVTAITIQRVGNGAAIFYYTKYENKVPMSVRILNEVNYTIQMASQIIVPRCLEEKIYYPIEIHIDIGNGGSSKYKNMAIGFVKGCGFDEENIRIKPDAYGATCVADRYTR